ncbi:ABC-2 type transport system permease protein [Priestia aryabhattai]|uniref:ABC transporter permease subunit n=1 Tax=Priestia aryabhattai TaxID=412384 RepID=UPI0027E401F3|nr:ABC transporter permease subunit [Priestia aryabhattai]MDP9726516.1 ABC-2 type transport system permease protein [Priestia aryabhattai]
MNTICLREFKSLFKSLRSVIIILIIVGVTVGAASFLSNFKGDLSGLGLDNVYVAGLLLLNLIVGPLFVTSLSHDIINKESQSRTIRFLLPKTSRDKIVIGKFMGISLFWFFCFLISILLIVPFSKGFYFKELIQAIIFITYFTSLTLLLSSIINQPRMSMFVGIVCSIVIPVIGLWSSVSHSNVFINIVGYLTPYFYFTNENHYLIYVVPGFTLLFLLLSLIIFRKKDF